jgi:site-specific DNA recombinase
MWRKGKMMTVETKPRVALYSRVSSEEQANEGVSIDAQRAALKAYATGMNGEIFDEYVDGGYSGGTDDRPAFKRLIRDAREERLDIIAVCKLDRFFRNLRLLLNYLYELEGLGIKFISVQEGLDTSTPYGKFAVQIMGIIAEFERGRIGERVKDARRHIISRGDWPGGSSLYGYRWRNRERKWDIDTSEAEVVRKVYDLYLNNNLGMVPIADRLNDEGVLTRRGARWKENKIRQILTHEAYKGNHPLGISLPAIIDETTWQKAQNKREEARTVRRDAKGWLLQGLAYCGDDGHILKCVKVSPKQPAYYVCRARYEKKRKGWRCDLPYIRAEKLEAAVWGRLKEVLSDKDRLRDCVDKAMTDLEARRTEVGSETIAINKKLDEILARKERLGIAFGDGMISEDLYKQMAAKLKKQEAGLLKSRGDLDPSKVDGLAALEARIAAVKGFLEKGDFVLNDSGMYAVSDRHYLPLGFNPFRNTDGKVAIGEIEEMKTIISETTFSVKPGAISPSDRYVNIPTSPDVSSIMWWDAIEPPEFFESDDPGKRAPDIIRNMRAVFQFFDIKIFVYNDKVEIRGTIPQQIIDMHKVKQQPIVSIINSRRESERDLVKHVSSRYRIAKNQPLLQILKNFFNSIAEMCSYMLLF